MQFEESYLYHIYNQGNNKQKIFFDRENYLFFLRKINTYILPYADILAWCLMPNHFHLMVRLKHIEVSVSAIPKPSLRAKASVLLEPEKIRTFNNSIGLLLRSYTNAINKQQKRTGALFRRKTKAECINCIDGITPSFVVKEGIAKINIANPEKQYPQVCFNYIHQNPVKAKLVKSSIDWEFSSAIDYTSLRNGKLINRIVAEEYVNITI